MELIAALSLAGLALLGAQALLSALADARTAHAAATVAQDQAGMGFRQLRDALLMREAVAEGASPFFGDADGAAFSTRCPVAGGWLERCRVLIQLVSRGDSTVVQLQQGSGTWTDVMVRRAQWRLAYLEPRPDRREWRANWGTSIARPAAVALVRGDDTLVIAGGVR